MFAAIPAFFAPILGALKTLGVSAWQRALVIVATTMDEYSEMATVTGTYVKNVLLRALTLAVIVYLVAALVASLLAALAIIAPLWIVFRAFRRESILP